MSNHCMDDPAQRGDFITYSGRIINLLNFQTSDVRIEEIAHALSRICRFGGHCREPHNVAHHAVLVSQRVEEAGEPDHVIYAALHHDDTEAYLGDMISPLKKLLPEYQKFEERFAQVIAEALNFEYPFSESIRKADKEIYHRENTDVRWRRPQNPTIIPWNPGVSKHLYLTRHQQLQEKLGL